LRRAALCIDQAIDFDPDFWKSDQALDIRNKPFSTGGNLCDTFIFTSHWRHSLLKKIFR
jgi:hypothetical protein